MIPNADDKFKILIIEDSFDDAELYARTLKRFMSCHIDHFATAEEALEQMEQQNDYVLKIIDYNLPGMSGIEYLQKIKSQNDESAIIVVTGQGSEDIAVDFLRTGIDNYIQKSDINEKNLSEAVKKALERARLKRVEKEKQKELTLFAHTLAHDLKSPINRLKTYARLLTKNPDGQDEYIQNISEDADFLLDFIDSLLNYAECGRAVGVFRTVDLGMVIHQSIKNLEFDIERSHADITIDGDMPEVHGAEISLVQVFQNLISNSIKYCDKEPKIHISCTKNKVFYIISIKDNGIGIPLECIDNLFKPFSRLPNNLYVHGTGLGMALVKTVIDQHDGYIDVTPLNAGGTQFDIVFPKSPYKRWG